MSERDIQGDSQHDHGPNDPPNDPLHTSIDRATLDRLVRCAADGELSEQEAAAYAAAKASNPKLDAYERQERKLRTAVGRCMSEECRCPQALRDRITAMTGAAQGLSIAGTPAEPARRTAPFPAVRVVVAAAAAIAVVVTATVYLQNTPAAQPDRSSGNGVALADDLPSGVTLAGFMSTEHNRCVSHPTTIRKFTERDLEQVPVAFREVLGEEVTLDDLLMENATFVAAGQCRVPGKGPSIHLMYEAFDAQGQPVEVSLYIQRCGDKRFEAGKAYAVGAEGEGTSSIIGWRHDHLVYYLVTSSPEITRDVAESLHAPAIAGAI